MNLIGGSMNTKLENSAQQYDAYTGWGHINKAESIFKMESIVHAENSVP